MYKLLAFIFCILLFVFPSHILGAFLMGLFYLDYAIVSMHHFLGIDEILNF